MTDSVRLRLSVTKCLGFSLTAGPSESISSSATSNLASKNIALNGSFPVVSRLCV